MSEEVYDKDTLVEEIKELQAALAPQFEKDKSRTESQGRPFDIARWISGQPDDNKYPAGPAYVPLGKNPTLLDSFLNIDGRDLAITGVGAAACYVMGFANATKLGIRSGHRLGFWVAVPAVIMGLLAGTRRGWDRYLGFRENGNPPLYAGYTDDRAPYFMKHKVSDRHFSVNPQVKVDVPDETRMR